MGTQKIIKNPWTDITWKNTVTKADENRIRERFGSIEDFEKNFESYGLKLRNALPEPYTGNVDSKVYCLGMNPGEKDDLFELNKTNRDIFLEYTQKTLSHNIDDNMWFHLYEHSGYCWWRKITNELRMELKRNPQMFTIEYFPYHSKKGFKFPAKLPSYSYSNWLIEKAMEDRKFILILRHKKQWFKRIKGLESYERLFYIDPKKSRNLVISRNNIVQGTNCRLDINGLIKNF